MIKEVEGQEVIKAQGQTAKVKGPKHEQGGVKMNLPQGALVFSDRLTGPDGKTFAKREEERVRAEMKAKKALDKNPTDKTTRFTFDRIMSNNNKVREAELQVQEIMSGGEQMGYGTGKMGVQKYAYGTGPMGALSNLNRFDLRGYLPRMQEPQFIGDRQQNPVQEAGRSPFAQLLQNDTNRPTMVPDQTTNRDASLAEAPGMTAWERRMFFDPGKSPFPAPTKPEAPAPQPEMSEVTKDGGEFMKTATKAGAPFLSAALGTLGPAGLAISSVAPLVTTLLNRLGDKKPSNQFEDFGRAALESNAAEMRGAAGTRDLTKRDIDLAANSLRTRNSSRSINELQALDQATAAQSTSQKSQANTQYYNQLANLFSRRGQLQNVRDQAVMQGRKTAFDETEQQRDQFFTNLSQNFSNLGLGMMYGQRNYVLKDPFKVG